MAAEAAESAINRRDTGQGHVRGEAMLRFDMEVSTLAVSDDTGTG